MLSSFPTYQVLMTAFFSLLLTGLLTPIWIRFQKYKNVGQVVRTDGPTEHLHKQGTPTMGGLLIILTVIVIYFTMLGVENLSSKSGVLALGMVLATGVIGFIDDFSKVTNARSLGLKARYKVIWLLGVTLLFGYYFIGAGISTVIKVPLTAYSIELGWLYLPFIFFIIAGTTNSVNLTDGLDGLAAGTATIVMMAFAGIAFRQGNLDLAIFAAAVAGSCIGFLWYNSFPANIFMGDTGSFALGGAIAAMAILTKTELLLLIIGGIYVLESMSVMIQVFFFRYFNKRIFKMAPIHHHFEISGWSETTIMVRFWIVSGLLSGAGFALYFASPA